MTKRGPADDPPVATPLYELQLKNILFGLQPSAKKQFLNKGKLTKFFGAVKEIRARIGVSRNDMKPLPGKAHSENPILISDRYLYTTQ
jgi:hypothetical protein